MATLESLLREGIVICDGAMGTLLQRHGIPPTYPYEYANLTHADLIQSLHREYVAAGARIIETNTYGANRFKLAGPGMAGRVAEINLAAARNARAAAPEGVLVAGAIGPAGKPLTPMGVIDPGDARQAVLEQAAALLEGGVDLFVLETFVNLDELKLAVDAVRSLTDLPIVAHKTFIEDADALAEGVAQRAVATMLGWDVQVVGANCTVGPQRMLHILRGMAEAAAGRPLSVMPTPGLPLLVEGRIQYEAAPEYFARYGRLFAEAGARMIGGCCGTTPEHIRAMAGAVAAYRPAPGPAARPRVTVTPAAPAPPTAPRVVPERSAFARKLGQKYVSTVELDLPRGLDMSKVFEGAALLKARGCDCIDISDGARARLRMNPMVASTLIQQQVGIEVMMHFSCRDRNLLAIQSDLLGAHALGLRNILAITGDPAQIGDYPVATSVFDVDSIGLVRVLRRFNDGLDLAGNTIKEATAFLIAVGFNPLAPDSAKELDRLKAKVDEGAQLIYTQPIYERHVLDFAAQAAARLKTPMLVGILPLRSSRHAEFLHNEVPGISVPDAFRRRIADMDEESAKRFGVEAAREFLRQARPSSAGVYPMPPFGPARIAAEVLDAL